MTTSAQGRAGRGLSKVARGVPAARASTSAVTLNTIESGQVAPRARTVQAILDDQGVRFIGSEAEGFGVPLKPTMPAVENRTGAGVVTNP